MSDTRKMDAAPIRTKRRGRRGAPWTAKELKSLGKTPDSALARRYRRTISEVVAERERRRIRLCTGPRRWTPREVRLLGTMFDYELARRLERHRLDVFRQRRTLGIRAYRPWKGRKWTRPEDKLLGTAADREIAARLKRTRMAVKVRRNSLGILDNFSS